MDAIDMQWKQLPSKDFFLIEKFYFSDYAKI